MFKRHFWRGQAYHGQGYHPRVSDIGRERAAADPQGAFARAID